jgi:tetratricopeptide (TPR) repeat protein
MAWDFLHWFPMVGQSTIDHGSRPAYKRLRLLLGLAIFILTFAVHSPALRDGFVNYDDHRYITMNPRVQEGLNLENLAWAFTTFDVANWHPLTWLSHMLDCDLYRMPDGSQRPAGHHLTSVTLHALNAMLVFWLFTCLTLDLWRSACLALFFALHPLRVESVTWISERKDVLSAFFGLLSILAYARWTITRSSRGYVAVVALFAASLMAKPMLVTLPAMLLLLDYWPLQRQVSVARALLEKLPLALLSLGSSIITIIAQFRGGSVSTLEELPLAQRLVHALIAYGMYIRQTLWPCGLAPFYPRADHWSPATILSSAAVVVGISVISFGAPQRYRHLRAGWLWYLLTLLPVIGIISVGGQAWADRYTYIPSIGLLILAIWSMPWPRRTDLQLGISVITCAILILLSIRTIQQISKWRDSVTLGLHTIAVTRPNAVAHFNLGNAYVQNGEPQFALAQFEQASSIDPNWADPLFNLGNIYLREQEYERAIDCYSRALQVQPSHANAQFNLAIAHSKLAIRFAQQDRAIDALPHFAAAMKLDPANALTAMYYGSALAQTGNPDAALIQFQRAADLAIEQNQVRLLTEIRSRESRLKTAIPPVSPGPQTRPR